MSMPPGISPYGYSQYGTPGMPFAVGSSKSQPVRIGPFSGGLNTYSDPSAIGDTDATILTNFDVDLDGSLISRPPITSVGTTSGLYAPRILGSFSTTTKYYLIFAYEDSTGAPGTGFYNITDNVVGTITTTFAATAMVQYQNKAWLLAPPTSANPGGSWDGTTFTAVATMAKGTTAVIYKERIFVGTGIGDQTNPARVYFSAPANPTSWTGTDFFDVSNGDGQPIIALYSYSGSIAIFKKRSTYAFAYETAPTRGQVQAISTATGLENADCIAEFENILYIYYDSYVYAIVNWNWQRINVKVPLAYSNQYASNTFSNFSVSNVNTRIIVRYYDNYYVYGTRTKAWSLWNSTRTPHKFFKSPVLDTTTGVQTYFAGNYLNHVNTPNGQELFRLQDTYLLTNTENFTCTVQSKAYSFNVPYSFKRLAWWGADVLVKTNLDAVVTPIAYGQPTTIAQLMTKPISTYMTHSIRRPLDSDITVTDTVTEPNPVGIRTFIKYLKSLRFRQIEFKLSSTIDGTTNTGPVRIYSVTAFIANKSIDSARIN